MLKRIGLFSLLLCGAFTAVTPKAAQAQDRYNDHRNSYYNGDGYHQDRDWRDSDRCDRDDRHWRSESREHHNWKHQRRDEEWRERYYWDHDSSPAYYPGSSFYFQYSR